MREREAGRIRRIGEIAEKLILEGRNLTLSDLALDGKDLLERGYRGKAVGQGLERLLEQVCVDGIPNRRESLLEELDLIADEKPG